jgi:hypothetical protein
MKPRIWTTVGDLRWLRPLELSHNFCRAISWNARLLYPTKLPRRPFAIEAVTGQKQTSRLRLTPVTCSSASRPQ